MSKLKELIDRLCPDGVPFMPLGEVLGYEQPSKYIVKSTEYDDSYSTPVLTAGQSFILGYTDETQGLFRASKQNPVIIFDDFTTSFHWVDFDFKVKSSAMKMLRATNECVIFRYVFYAMSCINYVPTQHARHWISEYSKFTIPIPPIEVQEEIVRILDTFSAHAAELQAELQARKEQYEYYRNLLLTFNPSAGGCGTDGEQKIKVTTWGGHSYEITWKTMGEICKNICSGGTPLTSVKAYYQGNIPWLRTQEVDWKDVYDTEIKISDKAVSDSSAKLIPANCVIIAMYGATAAKCCINKIALTTNQACCNLEINPIIANYRYVYQWICNNYNVLKAMGEGSQSNLNVAKIRNFKIPIPPLELQEKIVAILDRFEALVNDLTQGLPAEIAAVQERYEYYRNRLLTFRELA